MKRFSVFIVALLSLAYLAALGISLYTQFLCSDLDVTEQWLGERAEIILRPSERRGRAGERIIYSLDGRSTHDIALNETLTVRKAPMPLRLLSLPGNDYAARLRAKLGW